MVLQGRDKFRVETFSCGQHTGEDLKRIPKYLSNAFKDVTEFKDLTNAVIRQLAFTMASTYSSDLQSGTIADEVVQFAKSKGSSTPAGMMKVIHEHDLHSAFTNVGYP